MAFVSDTYNSVVSFLDSVSESQFGAISSAFGNVGLLFATVAALLVIINMGMQYRTMPWQEGLLLVFKLMLVAIFFQNWRQFDALAGAIFDVFERVGGALIASVGSSSGGEAASISSFGSLAEEFDKMLETMGRYADQVASELGIIGGGPLFSLGFSGLMGILGAFAVLVMTAARVIITVLIGLAPIMILMTLTRWTKEWFERWVSACLTFALYPVIVAGVFATIFGVIANAIDDLGDPEDISGIGDVIPIFMAATLSIALVVMIPFIASMLSGSLQMTSAMGAFRQAVMGGAAKTLGAGAKGAGAAANVAKQTKNFASDMARNPKATMGQVGQQHAQNIASLAARTQRLTRR